MLLPLLVTLLCLAEGKLSVIGAGMGRTGTSSLKIALEHLGFGKTHHMSEVTGSLGEGLGHLNAWVEVMNATFDRRVEIFDKMFTNSKFHSLVDAPGSPFYKELSSLYPDAKVILTERDTPEDWAKSMKESVGQFAIGSTAQGLFLSSSFFFLFIFVRSFMISAGFWLNPGVWLLMYLNPLFGRFDRMVSGMPTPRTIDQDKLVAFYKDWGAGVREYFKDQPEKLLIFNAKQGWEPLCKFLDVPVPSTRFPRVNESEHVKKLILILNMVGVLHLLVLLWLCRWCCRKAVALCSTKKNKTA